MQSDLMVVLKMIKRVWGLEIKKKKNDVRIFLNFVILNNLNVFFLL